ncbi:MAG TPA: hypothetical protein VGB91_10170 [Rhizomicrobium sp.]
MSDQIHTGQSYEDGRRAGLAIAAFALAVTAFINLLGIEKSLLAGALAILALKGAAAPRWAKLALALAAVHVAVFATAIVLLRDKFGQLFLLLHKLS